MVRMPVRAAQTTRIPTRLVVRVDVQADQVEPRVLDHGSQRACADVPRRPLDDPMCRHLIPRLSGRTQLGSRFSMKARMPSRGSGEWSSAQNIVW